MRVRRIFFTSIMACALTAGAQQYPFDYYTPREGLVNSRVRGIYQDSRGQMNFLTFGGLCVYDGNQFYNYTRENGLGVDMVNDVLELGNDSLLVATNTNYLSLLSRGKLVPYITSDGYIPIINQFLRTRNGDVYVAADEGLFLFRENRFIRLPVVNEKKEDCGRFLERVYEAGDHLLLVPWSSSSSIKSILFSLRSQQLSDINPDGSILQIETDQEGRAWATGSQGLLKLDDISLSNGKLKTLPLPKTYRRFATRTDCRLLFDRESNLWLYGGRIVQKISPNGDEQLISSDHGLKTNNVTKIFQDREGLIWMATDGNGVIKMKDQGISLLSNRGDHRLSISAISNRSDTLLYFDAAAGRLHYLPGTGNHIPLHTPRNFRALNIYQSGSLLYLTNEHEIYFTSSFHPGKANIPLGRVNLRMNAPVLLGSGILDPHNNLCILVRLDSLFFLAVVSGDKLVQLQPIPYNSDQQVIDRDNRLWIITRDNNLMVYDINPRTANGYLQLRHDFSRQLGNINPRSLTLDHDNNVWIGTRYAGLFCFRQVNGKLELIRHLTKNTGLVDNFITHLYTDHANNIWAGTQSGVDRVVKKGNQFIVSNPSSSNDYYQMIMRITGYQGKIWALTSEGSLLTIEDKLAPPLVPPGIFLTSVTVNNEDSGAGINKFRHFQNDLSFRVASPSFRDEGRIRYRFLLEGSGSKMWSDASENPNFHFINLPPGEYDLQVEAIYPNNHYPPGQLTYSFTILAPWWHSWLFRVPMLLLLLAIIVFFIRFIFQRKWEKEQVLLEKRRAVEEERTRIATDIHDDLGAGLSRIKFLSETIGIKNSQLQPVEEEIGKIRSYSHEMIDKMGEIVWALNEKNDSLLDLVAYTRSYALEYLSQFSISCSANIPSDIPPVNLSGEYRRNIFLTVKEALHNVVKHSGATEVKLVFETGRELLIHIQDNGLGFEPGAGRPFSNGIINMHKRMASIKGKLLIKQGEGTHLMLSAPLSI